MTFDCASCGTRLEAPEELYGAEITCPACRQTMRIPFPTEAVPGPSGPDTSRAPEPAPQTSTDVSHDMGAEASGILVLIFNFFPLLMIIMGLVFTYVILVGMIDVFSQYVYRVVPCTIIESEVLERDHPHRRFIMSVKYEYARGGNPYTGDSVRLNYRGSDTYSSEARLVRRFPVGRETVCYVHPRDPQRAVLMRESLLLNLLVSLMALAPLLLVWIGVKLLIAMWRRKYPEKPEEKKAGVTHDIKSRGDGCVTVAYTIIFSIFSLIGASLLFNLSIRPIAKVIAARHWIETPCRMQPLPRRTRPRDRRSQETGRQKGSFVLYEYEFNGQIYKNDQYAFQFAWWYSGREARENRIAGTYRRAENPTCFVNPKAPYESVLVRRFRPVMLTGFIFGIPLLWLGIAGFRGKLYRK